MRNPSVTYHAKRHPSDLVLSPIARERPQVPWNGRLNGGGREFNSVVTWTLAPKAGGTELQLQHTGFTIPEDMRTHNSGWMTCVNRWKGSINAARHVKPNA